MECSGSAGGRDQLFLNNYSNETAPKFEIFDDRLEITSHGGLPETLLKEEFFEGLTIPRNKELMRIFKDLDLVEQLDSGIPRILEAYPKESFRFSENFLRITLPSAVSLASTMQDTMQVEGLLKVFTGVHSRGELQEKLALLNRDYFRKSYLQPAIEAGLIALTIPDKPTSGKQQYYLTEEGKALASSFI